jgi:hypothetical protein
MKCPECPNKQKPTAGKTCRKCGYVFALDPREAPKLSDRQMKKAIDNLSGAGNYYFTFNQLYAVLYRIASKSPLKQRLASAIVMGVVSLIVCIMVAGFSTLLAIVLGVGATIGIIWFAKRPVVPEHEALVKAIKMYSHLHPIEHLVDGTKFRRETSKDVLKKELFDYAPERILIVQSNDLVDMLVLNRFHFENKTVVVGASKYPEHVFTACQKFLQKKPDIPVEILHDASMEGYRLKDKLLADESWNLKDKDIKDLGLSVQDVGNIQKPIWLPGQHVSHFGAESSKDPVEGKIEQGMKMPVDFVGPGVLLGALSVAAVAGMALMSTELLAEQAKKKDYGGGYG